MFLRRVCKLLVAGAVVVTAGRAVGDDCASPCAAPCPPVTTCKVRVVEMVPEQVPVTRTTYKVECRNEVYTAYRCEVVPETRPCTRTVWKPVCETVMETRTCCVRVPVTEQRTCYRTVWVRVSIRQVVTQVVYGTCSQTRLQVVTVRSSQTGHGTHTFLATIFGHGSQQSFFFLPNRSPRLGGAGTIWHS